MRRSREQTACRHVIPAGTGGCIVTVMRITRNCVYTLFVVTGLAFAQSPAAEATGTIGGKTVTIKYSSPSVRGRDIFGAGGVVSKDGTYPVWRAGANAATTLTTPGNLDIGGLNVPAGTYSLYVDVKDPDKWK